MSTTYLNDNRFAAGKAGYALTTLINNAQIFAFFEFVLLNNINLRVAGKAIVPSKNL
jgi:hypothetical protein